MKRRATKREIVRVEMIETPIWCPMSLIRKLSEKTKGRKTVTVVSVAARIERQTSRVPCVTDCSGLLPAAERR